MINWSGMGPTENEYNTGLGDIFGNYLNTAKLKHEMQQAGTKAKFAEPLAKSKLETNQALLQKYLQERKMQEKYGEREKEAELAHLQAQTKRQLAESKHAGMSSTQKDIAALHPVGSPEYQEALATSLGLGKARVGEPDSMNKLSYGRQQIESKNMHSLNKQLEVESKILRDAKEFKKLLDDNPDMWKDFNQILVSESPNSLQEIAKLAYKKYKGDPKKIAAIEKAAKYSASMVLGMSSEGGQRATDFYRQLVQATKVSPRLTPEANYTLLKNLEDDLSYVPEMSKALSEAQRTNAIMDFDYNKYRPKKDKQNEESNALANALSQTKSNTFNGIDDTGTPVFNVPIEMLDKFKASGGQVHGE